MNQSDLTRLDKLAENQMQTETWELERAIICQQIFETIQKYNIKFSSVWSHSNQNTRFVVTTFTRRKTPGALMARTPKHVQGLVASVFGKSGTVVHYLEHDINLDHYTCNYTDLRFPDINDVSTFFKNLPIIITELETSTKHLRLIPEHTTETIEQAKNKLTTL